MNGSLLSATQEPGEPAHGPGRGHSAWWSWTAPGQGKIRLQTYAPAFLPALAVYTGNNLTSLVPIAAGSSPLEALVTSDVPYHIAIDTADGRVGLFNYELHFEPRPAALTQMAHPSNLPEATAHPLLLGIEVSPGASGASGARLLQVRLTGAAGCRIALQSSADLVHWTTLREATGSEGGYLFEDTVTPGRSQKFYRAVLLPLAEP
jgi:hypothetical protein